MQVNVLISLTVYSELFGGISEVKLGVSFNAEVEGGEWPCVLKSMCPLPCLCPHSGFLFLTLFLTVRF